MKKLVCATWAAACLVPASVDAHNRSSPQERWFAKRCGEQSQSAVLACVHRAALHWGVSYQEGKALSWRESNWNPNICNSQGSGACGLFQFMPRTWGATPYGRFDVFDAKYNALAWAWAWSRGWQSHWGY